MAMNRLGTLMTVVAVAGCGARHTLDSGSTIDSATDGWAVADSGDDLRIWFEDTGQFDSGLIVDGGGDCTRDVGLGSVAASTCCNGVPCMGNCVLIDDGGVICNCYGAVGGCLDGLLCCSVHLKACATAKLCSFGK